MSLSESVGTEVKSEVGKVGEKSRRTSHVLMKKLNETRDDLSLSHPLKKRELN